MDIIKFIENVWDEIMDFLPGFIIGAIFSAAYVWLCYITTGNHAQNLVPIGASLIGICSVFGFLYAYAIINTTALRAVMAAINGASVGCGVLFGAFLMQRLLILLK